MSQRKTMKIERTNKQTKKDGHTERKRTIETRHITHTHIHTHTVHTQSKTRIIRTHKKKF